MFKLLFLAVLSVLFSGALAQADITSDDGLEVYPEAYPWSTYIQILDDVTIEYVNDCFGALISPSWVFTLAQCTYTPYNTYRLHFGAENFTNSEVTMISRNYITYPEYNPAIDKGLNNVGLIELPSPIAITTRISPVPLPWQLGGEWDLSGMLVHFIGRRHILNEASGISHPILRYHVLEIISDEACDEITTFRSGRMCTIGAATNPMQTPCNSLGYIVGYKNFRLNLVGGSGTDSCSDTNPNFFPRVTDYLDWITNVTGIVEE